MDRNIGCAVRARVRSDVGSTVDYILWFSSMTAKPNPSSSSSMTYQEFQPDELVPCVLVITAGFLVPSGPSWATRISAPSVWLSLSRCLPSRSKAVDRIPHTFLVLYMQRRLYTGRLSMARRRYHPRMGSTSGFRIEETQRWQVKLLKPEHIPYPSSRPPFAFHPMACQQHHDAM